eukprot:3379320-Pleurochrysis_carterae.AAC.2
MSCLRRPAGRADRNGSQQAAFTMELPSVQPLERVLALCEAHPQARYTMNDQGKIEWVRANTIDTFYIESAEQLSKCSSLHRRGLEGGACLHNTFACSPCMQWMAAWDSTGSLAVHGSSKGVLPTK